MREVGNYEVLGLKLIETRRFSDHRGFFAETYSRKRSEDLGLGVSFVQDNHSVSLEIGTLRGLHFQAPPHAQAKLVRCGLGRIFDVAVDIRRGSPTFGQLVGEILSQENGKQLFIPEGFAHGFLTLSETAEFLYKTTDYYAHQYERSIVWNDASLSIEWPLSKTPLISEKDSGATNFFPAETV